FESSHPDRFKIDKELKPCKPFGSQGFVFLTKVKRELFKTYRRFLTNVENSIGCFNQLKELVVVKVCIFVPC
ncbi:MAG: hypothetical protein ACK5JD_08190, partial [Mangrovibacterium sp.]